MSNESDELTRLRAENPRLIALRESNGIDWQRQPIPTSAPTPQPTEAPHLSTVEKVTVFRRLFRGRADVYPVRWESATTGKSGYAPACANEWRPGICEKPRIKCADCGNRSLISVSDAVIYSHLAGEKTIGVYPLLPDGTCYFLAVDFDKAEWREDAKAFAQSCRELDAPVALEISRSGNGAHAWIFYNTAVPARDARRLGTAVISHVCSRTRQLSLTSYDRLFPNQDTMPKGGFGNLIALPLQKKPRESGHSVFQEDAVAAMLPHDLGVLCAPTAFGKTVTGAAIIASRRVSTLILVHRTELLRQWQARLNAFLGIGKDVVGTIGGGRRRPTGKIDIAAMHSLSRKGEVDLLVEGYGQVIVDECHHVGAVSFDAILKSVKARYVLGLTATPIRRDGQQPIIFMQRGPIRHTAATHCRMPTHAWLQVRPGCSTITASRTASPQLRKHLPEPAQNPSAKVRT